MTVTKQTVVDKLAGYLRHEISLAQLVDWAENTMLDGDLAERDAAALATVVSRLGLADVRAFGLTWEDCEEYLRQLGYSAHVEIVAGQPVAVREKPTKYGK
ncbi:MAG: hypothetical protein PCFJNLEI_03460 [Verrucomicrobiae bacterium]|nr:hypothetical protein [Verrucomicrobiae bacterium]